MTKFLLLISLLLSIVTVHYTAAASPELQDVIRCTGDSTIIDGRLQLVAPGHSDLGGMAFVRLYFRRGDRCYSDFEIGIVGHPKAMEKRGWLRSKLDRHLTFAVEEVVPLDPSIAHAIQRTGMVGTQPNQILFLQLKE